MWWVIRYRGIGGRHLALIPDWFRTVSVRIRSSPGHLGLSRWLRGLLGLAKTRSAASDNAYYQNNVFTCHVSAQINSV